MKRRTVSHHSQSDLVRLKDLFVQAIEMPGESRGLWLMRQCRWLGPELREALFSVLAAHAAAGQFLSDPTLDCYILRHRDSTPRPRRAER